MVFSSTRINFVSKYLKLLMTSQILLAKTFAFIFGWHLYSESEKRKNTTPTIQYPTENECIVCFGVHSVGSVATPLNIMVKIKSYALEGVKVYIF